MKRLREQLIALQSIPSETKKAKESKIEMNKIAMKSFIVTSLDMGIEASTVHRALANLHTKDTDIVVDSDVYQWCILEMQKENALRNPESSYPVTVEETPEVQPFNEVNFGEVVVQNSLLACHLLDGPDLRSEYPNSLFEVNKSDFLSLEGKEASSQSKDELFLESCTLSDKETESGASDSKLSPNEGDAWPILSARDIHDAPVHQYLIAKGVIEPDNHMIYYMAFSSHQSLKEWNYGHMSFEDGKVLFFVVASPCMATFLILCT